MYTTCEKSRPARARRRRLEPGLNTRPPSQRLGELVAAQEQERRRIARDLHDQMGQHVVALSLGLARLAVVTDCRLALPALSALAGSVEGPALSEVRRVEGSALAGSVKGPALPALSEVRRVEGSALAGSVEGPEAAEIIRRLQRVTDRLGLDVHRLALELRPSALDHLGLAVAMCNYAEETARQSGLDIDTHCQDVRELQLPSMVETAVFRIAQEALTNVVKHAKAQRVSVILEQQDGAVQLIVEDDGIGFEPEALLRRQTRERLGLAGMHERAALIGGVVSIESTLGSGTALYLRLPFLHLPFPETPGSP